MVKIITAAAVALIGLLANAQVSETRNVSPFNKLEITDGVEIIYSQSDTFSIRAEASDALGLSSLITDSQNNTLSISCKGNLSEPAKVFVSAPELVSIKASGRAFVKLTNGLRAQNFELAMATGAVFKGSVYADNTTLKARSGAEVNIRLETQSIDARVQNNARLNLCGTANRSNLQSFGNALIAARNFKSDKGAVKASGMTSVEICAVDEIDVQVTDSAQVRYYGFPKKTTVNADAMAQAIHDTSGAVAHQ